MAIFKPRYRTSNIQKQKILYYTITAAIIIVAVVLLIGPCSSDKEQPIIKPAKEMLTFKTPPKALDAEPEIIPVKKEVLVKKETLIEKEPQPEEIMPADTNPTVNNRVLTLLQKAQENIEKRNIIAARGILNDVFSMPIQPKIRENIRRQMAGLADEWLFSKKVLISDNLCGTYKVQPGDIFSVIAKKYKVPYEILMKINNITNPRSLQVGQTLKVINGPFHAIIYRSAFFMDVYLQNTYVRSYKIGTGKEGRDTPLGQWRVKSGGKLIKPSWTDPETNVRYTADDPDYPLGSGYIALEGIEPKTEDISGIALHGTKDENTISTRSSRGCIRLFNGDLIELFNMLEPVHSEVNILE